MIDIISDIKLFSIFMLFISLRLTIYFSKQVKGSFRHSINASLLSFVSMILIPVYADNTNYYYILYLPVLFIILALYSCIKEVKTEKAKDEAVIIYRKLKHFSIEFIFLLFVLIVISLIGNIGFF